MQESDEFYEALDEMQVTNPTVALELLAKDAHPLQQYRELTENGIPAITNTDEGTGEILWDVDWEKVERDGVYRLACIDNGVGMTGEEQVKYINTLFMSGQQQAVDANFGVGAKVTAGARNPYGVLYLSWKDGASSMIHFKRAAGEGSAYGLVRWEQPDGLVPYQPVPPELKPDLIEDHGTAVVLLGENEQDDTILPPAGSPSQGVKWLSSYLNSRYFQFPDGVTVRVREFPADIERWPERKPRTDEEWQQSGTRIRRIAGMREYLDKYSQAGGTVAVSDAVVWWWILEEDLTGGAHEVNINRGHTAALFQDELYDLIDGNSHRHRMQTFGILYASKRLVLYAQPTAQVTANISRDSLKIGGEPLPWERWGEEFKEKMPSEIEELERQIREEASTDDYTKTIEERLKPYRDLFKVTSWRETKRGQTRASGAAPSGDAGSGVLPSDRETEESSGPGRRRGGGGGTSKSEYHSRSDPTGVPAEEIRPKRDLPKVEWVPFSKVDRPDDRAADYVREQNIIFVNTEFRVFSDMKDRFMEEYGAVHEHAEAIVTQTLQEWYGQILTEAVIRSWSFEHEVPWQSEDYRRLVSPEALTAAVLPFSLMDEKLRRSLSQDLSRPAKAS